MTLQDMHKAIIALPHGHGEQAVFRLYRNLSNEWRAQWKPFRWGEGTTAQAAIDAAFWQAMEGAREC